MSNVLFVHVVDSTHDLVNDVCSLLLCEELHLCKPVEELSSLDIL